MNNSCSTVYIRKMQPSPVQSRLLDSSVLLLQTPCLCVVVVVIRIIPRFLAMKSTSEF